MMMMMMMMIIIIIITTTTTTTTTTILQIGRLWHVAAVANIEALKAIFSRN
jgi:hypothetical protein